MKFRIDVHLFVHGADNDLLNNIFTFTKLNHQQNSQIMADLSNLTQEVSETRTVMASAVTLLQGLKKRLDEAGTDPVKLQELSASLDQGTNELAAAITANTPADNTGGGTGEPPVEGENTGL